MRLAALVVTFILAATTLSAGQGLAPFQGQSLVFGRPYSHVYQGRWCGHQDAGDSVEEDCSFDTFRQCRFAVVGANNGFCTQNPAFAGYYGPPPRKKKRRRAAY